MKEIEIKQGTKYIVSNSIHSSFSVGEIVECVRWHPSGMSIYSNGKFSSYLPANQLNPYKEPKEDVAIVESIRNLFSPIKNYIAISRQYLSDNLDTNLVTIAQEEGLAADQSIYLIIDEANKLEEKNKKLEESHNNLLEVLQELTYQLTGDQEDETELENGLGVILAMRVNIAKKTIENAKKLKK